LVITQKAEIPLKNKELGRWNEIMQTLGQKWHLLLYFVVAVEVRSFWCQQGACILEKVLERDSAVLL
jgi:hypothetical protein